MKYLNIIENEEDQEIIKKIARINFDTSLTPIQIENFLLNDVEYPTEYGKYCQTKMELSHRLNKLVDLYYDIREDEIKIRKLSIEIRTEKDNIEVELLELKKEKLEVSLLNKKKLVISVLKEIKIFYDIYNRYPAFHVLTPNEAQGYEVEQWISKTLNMPNVFEERYGEKYMRNALGDNLYNDYVSARKAYLGLLPREIFKQKQIGEK